MSRPKYSQNASSRAIAKIVTAQRGTPRFVSRVSLSTGSAAGRLSARSTMRPSMQARRGGAGAGVDRLPDVIARPGEFVGAADFGEIVARPRQRHGDDLLHAAVLHHHDAVGEQHRLIQ